MPAEFGPPGPPASADWSPVDTLGRHPGWPARLGPLAVPAGVVTLRPLRMADGPAWSRLRLRDQTHLENWEPTAPGLWEERNSVSAWLGQWWSLRALARHGQSLPFMIMLDGEFVGQITVGSVVRGSLCSAWIGYWVAAHAGRGGVATASVALLADHCFAVAGLHRLEATVRPENAASLRVLAKLGFREEGMFRRYLDVAGSWRDHLCLAITVEEITENLVHRLISSGRAHLA